jgi:Asp-tRNA(Asn)/Glu-tRNA(Gln) amidotransferase A subunit family amidase
MTRGGAPGPARAETLKRGTGVPFPRRPTLAVLPFAVKDNIAVKDFGLTAVLSACKASVPRYRYRRRTLGGRRSRA